MPACRPLSALRRSPRSHAARSQTPGRCHGAGAKARMLPLPTPSSVRRSSRGDQIVEVQVETPTNLSKKQKELLSAFADAGDTSPETDSFVKRVRRIWADNG